MTKWVEWSEPVYYKGSDEAELEDWVEEVKRMRVGDVILMRRTEEPRYESDQQALDDFLVVNWAQIVEYPE